MFKPTIGIIGNGRFGSLIFNTFKKSDIFEVRIFSRRENPDGLNFFSLKEVCECDIVIPAVPISAFENQIKSIRKLLKPSTLLVDVCSVKTHPVKVMLRNLPEDIDILATHPMFGPDSTRNGETFQKLKFIWAKVRIKNNELADQFLALWKDLGCELIELSPEEHDKQAAYTHAFAFLIGKIGMKMNVRRNSISTKGFEGILYNQTAVENDTGQLFEDMMKFNPFAEEMRLSFRKALENIENQL